MLSDSKKFLRPGEIFVASQLGDAPLNETVLDALGTRRDRTAPGRLCRQQNLALAAGREVAAKAAHAAG
jgi:hypothetical protein